MPQDVGIRPFDDVIHMQAVGRGSKGEFIDSDPMHLRIGPYEGDPSEKKQNASASRLRIFARIGNRSLLQLVHEPLLFSFSFRPILERKYIVEQACCRFVKHTAM